MGKLNISMLGAFRANLDETALPFSSDKLRALLAYLLLEGRPHRRESLAGLLWGEMPSDKAAANLRLSLSRLRQSLDPFLTTVAEDSFLEITRATVQIHPDANCFVDAALFDSLLNAVEAHPHEDLSRCSVCARRLEEAVQLYRGDFLSGLNLPDAPLFEEWQLREQEGRHQRALAALDALVAHKVAVAAWDEAQHFAEQQLGLEPWREEAYRRLMAIRMELGDRSGALAFYERCLAVLSSELGASPALETEALYRRISAIADKKALAATQIAAPTVAHNLPAQRLPFFGRENELRDLAALLIDPAYRLVTLMGMGGAGKTRLSQAAARRVLGSFPDGVWFVPLAAISGGSPAAASEVLQAIAAAVGYRFGGTRSEREQVLGYLADKRMLLLLDNFEQLQAVSELVLEILDAAQGITLLVTSRQRLLFHEEYAWLVDSLALPPAGASDVRDYSSVQLFVSRASQQGAFQLDAGNSAAVAEVCRLVDGIPLAIELAAGWTDMLAPAQIAAAIVSNMDFLQTSMRGLPARHMSIRAVFEGSWALLLPAEQATLVRLAVFRGSFALAAAGAVAALDERELRALSLKSLLLRRDGGRYEMHELLREYAGEKRAAVGAPSDALADAHSRYYLTGLGQYSAALEGPQARETLRLLQLDSGNLSVAWQWAVAGRKWATVSAGVAAFAHYLWVQGLFHEGMQLFSAASERVAAPDAGDDAQSRLVAQAALLIDESMFLTALGQLDESLDRVNRGLALLEEGDDVGLHVCGRQNQAAVLRRMGRFPEAVAQFKETAAAARAAKLAPELAGALADLGRVYAEQGYFAEGTGYLEEALALYQREENLRGQSIVLNSLGMIARRHGEYQRAQGFYGQTLQLAQQIDYREGIRVASASLGLLHEGLGQHNQALVFFRRALEISRQLGDRWSEAVTLGNMGTPYLRFGDFAQAEAHFLGSLQLALAINDLQGEAWAYQQLSWVTRLRGDLPQAFQYGVDALRIAREINDRDNMGFALLHMGYAALDQGAADQAIELFSEELALRRELGHPGLVLEALAALAAAYLAAGDTARAYEFARQVLDDLSNERLAGSIERFRIYFACYATLLAVGEPAQARAVIDMAWRALSAEANAIDRDDLRRTFLNDVPEHAQIALLAQGADSLMKRIPI